MKPIAPKPASISAYVSGSGIACVIVYDPPKLKGVEVEVVDPKTSRANGPEAGPPDSNTNLPGAAIAKATPFTLMLLRNEEPVVVTATSQL